MRQSPTVRLRRLASELRRLREEAGLTAAVAAKAAGVSASNITRLEGRQVVYPSVDQVEPLLDAYGVVGEQRGALLDLTRQARGKGRWHAYKGTQRGIYAEMEYEARVLRQYEASVIPGLLQTPDYTRALTLARYPHMPSEDVDQVVKLRGERQAHLLSGREQLQRLRVVIDEAAILRPIGGRDVMVKQLEHLQSMWALPNVTVQIAPMAYGGHAAMGSFTIITFGDPLDPEAVAVDTPVGEAWVEDAEGVAAFIVTFERLIAESATRADSLPLIEAAQSRLLEEPQEYGSRDYRWPVA